MYSPTQSDVVTHDVTQTCSYTQWASREILCDRNYMEVGHLTLIVIRFSNQLLSLHFLFLGFKPHCYSCS